MKTELRHSCVPYVPQVALEVIEELCYEMGLHRMEAMREYAIFLVTSGGELAQSSLIPPQSATLTHTLHGPLELEFRGPK